MNSLASQLTREHPDAMPEEELNRLAILLTLQRAHTVLIKRDNRSNQWLEHACIKLPATFLRNHDKTDVASGVIREM